MFIFYALFERRHSRYIRAVVWIEKLLEAESTCQCANFVKRVQRVDSMISRVSFS